MALPAAALGRMVKVVIPENNAAGDTTTLTNIPNPLYSYVSTGLHHPSVCPTCSKRSKNPRKGHAPLTDPVYSTRRKPIVTIGRLWRKGLSKTGECLVSIYLHFSRFAKKQLLESAPPLTTPSIPLAMASSAMQITPMQIIPWRFPTTMCMVSSSHFSCS